MNYIRAAELKVGDRVLIAGAEREVTEVVFGPYSKVAYCASGTIHETTTNAIILIQSRPLPPKPRYTIDYTRFGGIVSANLRVDGATFRLGTFEKTDEQALSSLMNRLVGDAKDMP